MSNNNKKYAEEISLITTLCIVISVCVASLLMLVIVGLTQFPWPSVVENTGIESTGIKETLLYSDYTIIDCRTSTIDPDAEICKEVLTACENPTKSK